MFGLEFLMAGWLTVQQNPNIEQVRQEISCQLKKSPQINVIPSKSRVRYDFTRSKADLNKVDVDTVSPYGPQHKTEVSGLMSGSIQVKHEMSFMHELYERLDKGCLFINSLDIEVHIEPVVYVASEYPKGTCMHNAVLTHEHKHVKVDRVIVNKYVKIIGQAMKSVINTQGSAFGPYELDRLPHVQNNIQNSLNKVLKKYNDKMNEERREKQQAVDSLEEYESIGARCPDKHKYEGRRVKHMH
ncbi:MAG: hypothetical protein AAF244_03385 [Pseudomonadota bacterium]